jgi:Flp pilus assembly protein TadG
MSAGELMDGVARGRRGCAGGALSTDGSVAVEFALLAPIIILLAAAIADFGILATKSAGLAATTRIGAEYARAYPYDTSGICQAMQSAMSFAPALSCPATFPRSCECNDETAIACNESCTTVGRPGPNRSFIRITATQSFTPLVPWPGIPGTLSAATEMRLQ